MTTQTTRPVPLKDISFFTKEWLAGLLSQYHGSSCHITSYSQQTNEKQGYLSEIVFVHVSYIINEEEHEEHLVLKFLPKDANKKDFVINGKLAIREVDFYRFSQTELFRSIICEGGAPLCVPEVLYADFANSCLTIVMKDLSKNGYKITMSRDGANLQQTLNVFSSIAKVHSAGLYHFQKNGNFGIERYEEMDFFDQYLGPNLQKLSDMYKGDLSNIFKRLIPFSKIIRDSSLRNPIFDTVIHGDLWLGQSMFSDDQSNICIIDWQFSTIGNPITDLMGMFFMSSEPYILEHNLSEILGHYWKELVSSLERYGVPIPTTYTDFVSCVEKHWMTGFMFIATSLHDFLNADNISSQRLDGLMNFLHKRKVFHNFLKENHSIDEVNE